jgi:hypothetical protein
MAIAARANQNCRQGPQPFVSLGRQPPPEKDHFMLYIILIYGSEDHVARWTPEEEKEVMSRHADLREQLTAQRRLGPVIRLTPHGAKTVRRYKERKHITDGPFTESKEQLMGLYVVDCATFEDAVAATDRLAFDTGVFVISPLSFLDTGVATTILPPDPRCSPST